MRRPDSQERATGRFRRRFHRAGAVDLSDQRPARGLEAANQRGAGFRSGGREVVRRPALSGSSDARPAIQAKFKAGLALHQQGKLAEAAKIYEDVLAADKAHFAALHCLGTIAFQTGELERALDLIGRAVTINPKIAATDPYRNAALNQLNRHAEALAVSDDAIRLKPDFVELHYNRGNALYGLGRLDEALLSYDKAIQLRPDFAEAWSNRGNTLQGLGRLEDAFFNCNKAVALKPDHAQGRYNRGNALGELKRTDEALASYDRAITLKPDYVQAWDNRGSLL